MKGHGECLRSTRMEEVDSECAGVWCWVVFVALYSSKYWSSTGGRSSQCSIAPDLLIHTSTVVALRDVFVVAINTMFTVLSLYPRKSMKTLSLLGKSNPKATSSVVFQLTTSGKRHLDNCVVTGSVVLSFPFPI